MRAGLDALRQGGSAVDAALTTAIAQVTLAAGSWVSFAGILTLVCYDAASGRVHSLNAGFDTVRRERDPVSIPTANVGALTPGGDPWGGTPSGRSALVPGFLAGVEAAHARFGTLSFAALFDPAIRHAEDGFEVSPDLAELMVRRRDVLTRLPEGRAIFTRPDGTLITAGERLRQPALARTLHRVASGGAAYCYTGAWAHRLVDAVRREGGAMTLEDLAAYEAIWSEPTRGWYRDFEIVSQGMPSVGGVNLIEALQVYDAAGLRARGPHTASGESLFWLAQILKLYNLSYLPPGLLPLVAPGIDPRPEARLSAAAAPAVWQRIANGQLPLTRAPAKGIAAEPPKHSDSVVAVDRHGNVAAMVHTINSMMWGKTGIFVDGVSINDAASFQQAAVARVGPGARLPDPTNPMLVLADGKPILGASAMGPALHQKTVQCLLNVLDGDMTLREAIDAPYLMFPRMRPDGGQSERVVAGAFPPESLGHARKLGLEVVEEPDDSRLTRGLWIAIVIDPETGHRTPAGPSGTRGYAVAY